MKWVKSPPELVARFDAAAPKGAAVVRKPMFGYPTLYLNGNMFAGTYQDKVVCAPHHRGSGKAARQIGALSFEPMPGRPMREYVVLPSVVVANPSSLARWIKSASEYAAALPAKAPRSAAPRTAKPRAARRGAS